MAQKISQMTEQTASSMTEAGTSDFLGGYTATGGNANRKFSLSGLANYFLNKFKMTLGGSSQTVKSAIDTLNSNIEKRAMGSQATSIPNGADLDTFLTYGLYCSGAASISATLSHAPTTTAGFLLEVKRTSDTNTILIQEALCNNSSAQRFKRWHNNSGWTNWIEEPNRSELDALNGSVPKILYSSYSGTAKTHTFDPGRSHAGAIFIQCWDGHSDHSGLYTYRANTSGGSVTPILASSTVTVSQSNYQLTIDVTSEWTTVIIVELNVRNLTSYGL